MGIISNTLRKYAEIEDTDAILRSVLREAADELDRKDGFIDAIHFDVYNYDRRILPKIKNEVQV